METPLHLWIAIVLIAGTLGSACGKTGVDDCGLIYKAAQELQRIHLAARPEIDAEAFARWCAESLGELRKANPSLKPAELALEALGSYASLLDPHSYAVSEKELTNPTGFRTGYGFTATRSEQTGRIEITDVIAGGPAHNAGMQEGMAILRIDGRDTRELRAAGLSELLSDPTRSRIKILVQGFSTLDLGASPETREIALGRGIFEASPVKLDSFTVAREPGPSGRPRAAVDIAYIKVRDFAGAPGFFAEALRTMRHANALILDLRDNAGGDVRPAADIGDMLFSGEVFSGFLAKDPQPNAPTGTLKLEGMVRMRDPGSIWDGPFVVLVNSGTKSVAELLAGALQDYGATVVGTRTYGKGTRQKLWPLVDFGIAGGLYVTDAFLVRPSGKLIQLEGVVPDVALPSGKKLRSEASHPKALLPPASQPPLAGYDPTLRPGKSERFRARLDELQTRLAALIGQGLLGSNEEEAFLEATRRVAAFVADELENDAASPVPAR